VLHSSEHIFHAYSNLSSIERSGRNLKLYLNVALSLKDDTVSHTTSYLQVFKSYCLSIVGDYPYPTIANEA
jgi:hypothetical protein